MFQEIGFEGCTDSPKAETPNLAHKLKTPKPQNPKTPLALDDLNSEVGIEIIE